MYHLQSYHHINNTATVPSSYNFYTKILKESPSVFQFLWNSLRSRLNFISMTDSFLFKHILNYTQLYEFLMIIYSKFIRVVHCLNTKHDLFLLLCQTTHLKVYWIQIALCEESRNVLRSNTDWGKSHINFQENAKMNLEIIQISLAIIWQSHGYE